MGAVLHTLNIRLPGEQLVQIVNAGEDKIILVDDTLVPLLAPVADQLETVEAFVVRLARDRTDAARIALEDLVDRAVTDSGYDRAVLALPVGELHRHGAGRWVRRIRRGARTPRVRRPRRTPRRLLRPR